MAQPAVDRSLKYKPIGLFRVVSFETGNAIDHPANVRVAIALCGAIFSDSISSCSHGQFPAIDDADNAGCRRQLDLGTQRVCALDKVHGSVYGGTVPLVPRDMVSRSIEEVVPLHCWIDVLSIQRERDFRPRPGKPFPVLRSLSVKVERVILPSARG